MDYENISNQELTRLLSDKMPELQASNATGFNRETIIAFLKYFAEKER
jgi:hypothetical protein